MPLRENRPPPPAPPIPNLIRQHVEEARFLWDRRHDAATSSQFYLPHLIELEYRLAGHLKGLRITGDVGWDKALDQLNRWPLRGDSFVAGLLAFTDAHTPRWPALEPLLERHPKVLAGVADAGAMLNWGQVQPQARAWLRDRHPSRRALGLALYARHRVDPGPALERAVLDLHPGVRVQAARALGLLGHAHRQASLESLLRDTDPAVARQAAQSLARLGQAQGARVLYDHARAARRDSHSAMAWLVQVLAPRLLRPWLERLLAEPDTAPIALTGIRHLGDPAWVPRLLDLARHRPLARLAGDVFAQVTGADLNDAELWLHPDDLEPEDENSHPDPAQEGLLWPDPDKLAHWWQANGQNFRRGRRYLLGRPLDPDSALTALREGHQAARWQAAVYRAAQHPEQPLFDIAAPGLWQRRRLFGEG